MDKLTQKKQDLISHAYVNFKDKNILVLDGISGGAFESFKRLLINHHVPIENEEVVFFRDLTWLGDGEEGILITNNHFYYYQWGFKMIPINYIRELKIGGLLNENIVFSLENGQTISIWAAKLFSEIRAVIEILQMADEEPLEDEIVSKQVQCLGCKAIIRANQKCCEYCRSPLS